jgi:hypothetical protein
VTNENKVEVVVVVATVTAQRKARNKAVDSDQSNTFINTLCTIT